MAIKHAIPMTIRSIVLDKISVKSFLAEVADRLLNRIKLMPSRILAS